MPAAVALHGPGIEQPHQGEKPMWLPMLAARDHERAVLGLEPSERVDEKVHAARFHERNLGQIHDERTRSTFESQRQDLEQERRRHEVQFSADAEHRGSLTSFFGRQQAHRERIGAALRDHAKRFRVGRDWEVSPGLSMVPEAIS
jgi:hypothetical protein